MVLEAPTLMTDVRIAVTGLISRVTVRQHFVNPSNAWMEGIYVFPLPERSAVDRLTMTVGGREIAGRIMEREAARKTYEKAAAQGKRASLLSSERANVFTTAVANIGPGEEIVIEIEYQDRVAYDDGRFSLRFPMVVAPRYTPPAPAP
ncbi:MAG: marine proteobacterial sortase target protein, partial [Proteobacteria bacterium]|nr:marine proteobacterial sortase target protein [Pseudomonadota bacterium]